MLPLIQFAVLVSLIFTNHISAGGKTKENETEHYIELGIDQGIYNAIINDSEQAIPVTKLSFAGDTVLDGVKKETDNSVSRVSLGEISFIEMLDPIYESRRYPQVELSHVKITTTNGISENMLMPRNLLICGQDRDSKIKKTWCLRKIGSIELEHATEARGSY